MEAPMSKFLLDDLWFDVVTWMGAAESGELLRERYEGDPWIWNFMPLANPVNAEGPPPAPFLDARTAFDLHPSRCIETLEVLSGDLRVRDISIALMKFFVRSPKKRAFLNCWVEIQNEIISIASHSPAGVDNGAIDLLQPELDAAVDFLKSPDVVSGVRTKGLNDMIQFIQNYKDITKRYEDKSRFHYLTVQSLVRQPNVLSSHEYLGSAAPTPLARNSQSFAGYESTCHANLGSLAPIRTNRISPLNCVS